MEPKIEVAKFASGDLQIVVRFKPSKNVRFEDSSEATWVPKYEELELIHEAVKAIDGFNIKKKQEKPL